MWRFRVLNKIEPERDPHEAEFFRPENPSDAIVREVIQNSLDAKRKGEKTVKVSFCFGETNRGNMNKYIGVLVDHLKECDFLPENYENFTVIPFITIEDYGTKGLDGPTGEDGSRPESNYFDFWMREGKSHKSGIEAGRWGMGKTTFHITSQFKSFWGFTVRSDDQRELLVGKSLLKTHRIGNDMYSYEGYFRGDECAPITDKDYIKQFKELFSIKRDKEPGLSLVIPFPDDDVSSDAFVKSVIIHYFYTILEGVLTVEISDSGNHYTLNSENLIEKAKQQDWKGTSWESLDVEELLQSIAESINMDDFIELSIDKNNPVINEECFGEKLEEIRTNFNECKLVGFVIPVTIKTAEGDSTDTEYKIILKSCPDLKRAEEFYIRSGIRISDIHTLGNRTVRGIMVVKEEDISRFLRDAETPAHTDWKEGTEDFKDKYEKASTILRFIKNSMKNIVSIIDIAPQEMQRDFLKSVFSIFVKKPDDERIVTRPPRIPPIISHPPVFDVNGTKDGFSITLKRDSGEKIPFRGSLIVAYDLRRGNPFKHYETFDFDLASVPIVIQTNDCNLHRNERNELDFEVTGKDFLIKITGFDPKRDLVVKVRVVK